MRAAARGHAWMLAAALLAGCSSGGHAAIGSASFRAVSGWRAASDPLSLSMRAISLQFERFGLHAERDAFRGFLTAGARGTHALDLPPRSCLTLIALASEGIRDMDASIYTPAGDLLAVDSQPDAHPTLQICGGIEPQRLYYSLQIYDGAGTFLMAAFTGPRAGLDAAAKLIGARATVADLSAESAAGPARISAFRDGVQRRGFQLVQSPVRVPLIGEQRIRAVVAVEPGACYTAAGFALDGLQGLGLRVLDDEGIEIARDGSRNEDASAQFCVERKGEFAAELQGTAGNGAALLLLFRAEAAQIGGRAGLWLGDRPLAQAATLSLQSAIASVARRATQDGFEHARTLRSGQLGPGAAIAQRVALPARRCARIHAVGGPGIRKLRLLALDASGHPLAQAEGDAESTYVHVCANTAREITLEAHAASGSGAFALSMHEAPLSALLPAGGDERAVAALQQASRQARDLGYKPLQDFEDARRVRLNRSEPLSIALEPDPMRCVRAYVIARGPARAELMLAGKPVATAIAGEGEPARFCTGKESAAAIDGLELRVSTRAPDQDAWVMVLER